MLNNKYKVLEYLVDGAFHSGESIGQALGISRSAVSSHIKSLVLLGLDIYSVTGKGYKLTKKLDLLEADRILSVVKHKVPIDIVKVTSSTNTDLMEQIRNDKTMPEGYTLLAEAQTAGKGRRGRQWQSPFASHIYFSQYRKLEEGLAASAGLSLAVGIAVAKTINHFISDTVSLKWPNDVLYKNQKLAGILVEAEGQAEGVCYLVIGIGVNVDMPEQIGKLIDQPWIDLLSLIEHKPSKNKFDRNLFVAQLMDELDKVYEIYKQDQLNELYEIWNSMNAFINKQVDIVSPNNKKTGKCLGIESTGALLIENNEFGIQRIFGGEVSLRASAG